MSTKRKRRTHIQAEGRDHPGVEIAFTVVVTGLASEAVALDLVRVEQPGITSN
jgi:hypothetical protein